MCLVYKDCDQSVPAADVFVIDGNYFDGAVERNFFFRVLLALSMHSFPEYAPLYKRVSTRGHVENFVVEIHNG